MTQEELRQRIEFIVTHGVPDNSKVPSWIKLHFAWAGLVAAIEVALLLVLIYQR